MATEIAAGYKIERIDLATADAALMRKAVAFMASYDAEERPEDPPIPAAMTEGGLRATSPMFIRSEWGAFDDAGDLVGLAIFVENRSGSNEDIRQVRLGVRADHRRRGIATALFAEGLAGIGEGQARLLQWFTSTRVPAGEAVSRHVGAKRGLHMRVSQADLRTIDRAKMREWAAIDPPGYRLEWVIGDIPDRLMPATVRAFNAINRMPKEDLDVEDWVHSEENVRDWERVRKARGQEQYLLLVIDDTTGDGVAFTDVVFDRRYPAIVHQGGTAVDVDHQRKRIGKWIKARMALRLLEDLPQARFIRTDNAGTNAKMLAINDQMGFTEAWWGDIWQMPRADAKRWVGERL